MPRRSSRLLTALLATTALVPVVAAASSAQAIRAPRAGGPALNVEVVASGLSIPWDVAPFSGGLLITERSGRILLRTTTGEVRRVKAWMGDLWVSGETGLMAIEADPNFAKNRRIYTCQGTTDRDKTVQVVVWTLNSAMTAMTRLKDPLIGNIPGSSGRHGGCQLRFDRNWYLHVGTGDSAVGTVPQNKWSLGGKTLRVSRFTGAGVTGNLTSGDRRIFTYGHRNVQGLALAPNGDMYSVEHGTDRNDEINLLQRGNYGWDPVPGYNESRPMTDLSKYPTAISAVWSSGLPTVATSGAAFLRGAQWGAYDGALAVACLKDSKLRIFKIVDRQVVQDWTPAELSGTYGRLRAAEFGKDGALYVTTSNGSNDKVLRITPA